MGVCWDAEEEENLPSGTTAHVSERSQSGRYRQPGAPRGLNSTEEAGISTLVVGPGRAQGPQGSATNIGDNKLVNVEKG